jgi:hypothetical protein
MGPSVPRESYTRCGEMAWNAPADSGPASFRHTPGVPLVTQTNRLPWASPMTSPRSHASVVGGPWFMKGTRPVMPDPTAMTS